MYMYIPLRPPSSSQPFPASLPLPFFPVPLRSFVRYPSLYCFNLRPTSSGSDRIRAGFLAAHPTGRALVCMDFILLLCFVL